jgi:phosphoglycerol geranylgeranyltransferase
MSIGRQFSELRAKGQKALAVLLDPDKLGEQEDLSHILQLANSCKVDFLFIGGSLMVEDHLNRVLRQIRSESSLPLILFPGSVNQLSSEVDAVLFLSLISGRNADLLIGQHVIAAPQIKALGIEPISTGYMLVDCGTPTTASYISGTLPIPYNKPEIAAATAMAGEMLGLSCFYLDGGSGAARPVSANMISAVRKSVKGPLIVGGGIQTHEQAQTAWNAGADILVVGTAFEKDPERLFDISGAKAAR